MRKYILLLLTIAPLLSCKQEDEKSIKLKKQFDNYYLKNKPPGIAVKILKNGKTYWESNNGYSDIESKIPFTNDKSINLGSVSKTITTVAILQLWEKGKIKLSDDINKYLSFNVRNPKFLEEPITIKQLLTHTSSIKDNKFYLESYSCNDLNMSLNDWLQNYFEKNGQFYSNTDNFYDWKPNGDYKYSNIAYGILGLIVEKVSKISFNEYCKLNIINPLKMNNSSWFYKDLDTSNLAKQYVKFGEDKVYNDWIKRLVIKENNEYMEICNYSFYNYPDGLFKTNIDALSNFLKAFQNKGKFQGFQLLKEETINQMLTLQLPNNKVQGIGWKRIEGEGFSLWGHSGRDPGVRTHMYFNPTTNIGIILFQNNDEGTTIKLIKSLYKTMIEK